MDQSLDDAIRLGNCLTLKIYLSQFTNALGLLVESLEECAVELREEDHPSVETGQRFRRRLDECIHQFWRVIGRSPFVDGGVHSTVCALIAPFVSDLINLLPGPGRCIIHGQTASAPYDWRQQLDAAADAADALAQRLRPHLDVAGVVLANKLALNERMDTSIQEILRVI